MSEANGDSLLSLQQAPAEVAQALTLVASLDECFVSGFASLSAAQRQILASFEALFEGLPLQQALQECNAALARHEFRETHFATLAAARSGLLGAAHDALCQQAMQALQRAPLRQAPAIATPGVWQKPQRIWMASTRHWLMELALAGFSRLEADILHPFMATLQQMQGDATLLGQGALLTGFLDELLAAGTRPAAQAIPAQRWVDLWARAMTSSLAPVAPRPCRQVSGKLYLLGCEFLAHDHLASLVFWGLLETEEDMYCCRATFSRYKPPAVRAGDLWLLLPRAQEALEAVAARRVLRLEGMTYLQGGDLVWDAPTVPAGTFDPLALAERYYAPGSEHHVQLAPQPATQRHPLQLALPLFMRHYTVQNGNHSARLEGTGLSLPLAWERLNPLLGLNPAAARGSGALFGLLRFDGGAWSLQPLALRRPSGRKGGGIDILTGETGAAVLQKPPKNDAVSTLQERAGRLLRAA